MIEVCRTLAAEVVAQLAARGWLLATAESCTGGLVADCLTDVAGASEVFDLGVITYANRMKNALLGVTDETLNRHGAVSEEAVTQMAVGVRARSFSTLAVAVSGIAGPSGGTPGKPVGTVYFALATPEGVRTERRLFDGGRLAIKQQAASAALAMVRRYCDTEKS